MRVEISDGVVWGELVDQLVEKRLVQLIAKPKGDLQ